MSDERDDAADSPADAADDADQSDSSPDPDAEPSGQDGNGQDGPATAGDASDGGDDDTGGEAGEQGEGKSGEAGEGEGGTGADGAGESVDGDSGEAGEGEEVTGADSAGESGDGDSGARPSESAGDSGDGRDGGDGDGTGDRGGADPERVKALAEELGTTREQLADLESRVDEKTVHRDDVMAELKRYVRARQRRGHATGWGPYLVLLYGTAMSLGAFYYLGGWPVIAALVVIWLSTLGLFVVMLLAGALLGAGRKLGSARDMVGMLRR